MKSMKISLGDDIAVIGLFHLGSVFSIGFASLGFKTLGLDQDKKIIQKLDNKQVPLHEPGLDKLLIKNRNNIAFSTDFSKLSDYSVIFFTQDTETDGSGSVGKLEQMIDKALPYFSSNVTIILVSQVPVGFHRKLVKYIKTKRKGLDFQLYHWVDTIVMTSAIERFLTPERIIIGKEDSHEGINLVTHQILNRFSCPVFEMNYESAEITKAAINLYLATSVTYANTLADYCEQFGGDIFDVIPALRSDKRIGQFSYIQPSLRIAGGHLERDLYMLQRLADRKKISSGIVEKVIKENDKRYLWVLKQINKISKVNKVKRISLLGLAYKKNSTSVENAPSIKVIQKLQGRFEVSSYDPQAIVPRELKLEFKRFDEVYGAVNNSDILILLTDWDELKNLDFSKTFELMKNKIIIDCIGFFSKQKMPNGFRVIRLGVSDFS